jgi:O-antigen ligase/Flp pilus assembly protein TadD
MKLTKQICKWIVLGGVFAAPFIPFIVSNTMFFPFITGKGFTFRILVEIVFGAYVLLALLDAQYRPRMSWITKAIFGFAAITLIADLLGANPYKSLWSNYERMEGFVLIIHLVMYYLAASSVMRTVRQWYGWINTTLAASLIMSLYGLLQIFGVITINQGGVRLDGTFGNSSYFAIYLVFHVFFCLYMIVAYAKRPWQKWAYGVLAAFETGILYFTATRGAILGLIGGLLFAAILVAWKEKENKSLRKSAYIALGAIVVVVLGFLAIRNASFVQRSPVLSRFSSLSSEEIRTQGRYYVWPMALKGIAQHPLLGWGQEDFNFVFNKNYNPQMYAQEQWFDRTHDIALDWLINGGILGFLAYASMFAALLYYIWRKGSMMTVAEKSILTGMIAAYVFHNLFVFDNLVSYILFFSTLGFVHAVSVSRSEPRGAFYTAEISRASAQYVALPAVIILTALAVYFVNVPAIKENMTLIQAITPQQTGGPDKNLALFKQAFSYHSFGDSEALEQLMQISSQIEGSQIAESLKQQFRDYATQKIQEKVAATPHDARYLVFAGSYMNLLGRYDDAITYLNRALEESPRKQSIIFELGSSYIGKKDYAKAEALSKQAYDLAPEFAEAQTIYAIGALYNKDDATLKSLSSKVSADTVISDNRFLRAYADIGNYQAVVSILQSRLQKDPTNLQYKLSLAAAYAQMGNKQQAVAIIRDMIKQEPSFATQGEQYIQQIQAGR